MISKENKAQRLVTANRIDEVSKAPPHIADWLQTDQTEPAIQDSDPSILVLSGTFQSGKTTLLRSLIERHGEALGNWVVIENDVGSAGIDANRLRGSLGDDAGRVLELTAGCICCKDIGSLGKTLDDLRNRPLEGENPKELRPDTILIETTGLAAPMSVKNLLDEKHSDSPYKMVVTMRVDVFERNLALGKLEGHLEAADLLVLTHWDHLPGAPEGDCREVDTVLQYVGSHRPDLALTFSTRDGQFGDQLAFGLRTTSIPSTDGIAVIPDEATTANTCSHGHHDHDDENCTHDHDHDLKDQDQSHPGHGTFTTTLHLRPEVTPDQLADLFRAISTDGCEVLCFKGRVGDSVVSGVFDRLTINDSDPQVQTLDRVINLSTTQPVTHELYQHLCKTEKPEAPQASHSQKLEAAIAEVTDLIASFPDTPFSDAGEPFVNFDADEGYEYLSITDFPTDLSQQFYNRSIELRVEALEAVIQSDRLADHPLRPYWLKELGAHCAWLSLDCGAEVNESGAADRLKALMPATRYFEGMAEITSGNQAEAATDVEFLKGTISRCYHENLSAAAALEPSSVHELVSRAISNMASLDNSGTWAPALEALLGHSSSVCDDYRRKDG